MEREKEREEEKWERKELSCYIKLRIWTSYRIVSNTTKTYVVEVCKDERKTKKWWIPRLKEMEKLQRKRERKKRERERRYIIFCYCFLLTSSLCVIHTDFYHDKKRDWIHFFLYGNHFKSSRIKYGKVGPKIRIRKRFFTPREERRRKILSYGFLIESFHHFSPNIYYCRPNRNVKYFIFQNNLRLLFPFSDSLVSSFGFFFFLWKENIFLVIEF